MKENKINKKLITELELEIGDLVKVDAWVERLRIEEPEYYEWTQHYIGGVISEMSANVKGFTVRQAHGVAHAMIIAFMSGWIILNNSTDKKFQKIMGQSEEEQFKLWMAGELPASYYSYSLRGRKKSSTSYIAKKAYETRKEKAVAKNKKLRMFRKVKTKVKEDLLSSFDGNEKEDNGKPK